MMRLSLLILFLITSCSLKNFECRTSWKTTGFYTPRESDFANSQNKTVKIKGEKSFSFKNKFLKTVKIEGWGKTRYGWYLGYYSGQWHKAKNPLNALGLPLSVGAIAVDNRLIPRNAQIKIPDMISILGIEEFSAVDVGSAINNKHIDIYTGEGDRARKLSYRVTGKRNVCF